MRTVEKVFKHKYISVNKVSDTKHHVEGYMFAERLGTDSIAFICEDPTTGEFLINHEYTPPTNEFLDRAFGGSLDKKDKGLFDIVKDEVFEEAGFTVGHQDIHPFGKVFVSTQMNQYCHLFLVYIDKNEQHERHPENEVEAMSHPVWKSMADILGGQDWKAITIIAKNMKANLVN